MRQKHSIRLLRKKYRTKIKMLLCMILVPVLFISAAYTETEADWLEIELEVTDTEETTLNTANPESEPIPDIPPEPDQLPDGGPEDSVMLGAEPTETPWMGAYANSISGMLWLDAEAYGDGILSAGKQPLAGYPVSLYLECDMGNAIQTVATGTDGRYAFTDIEPGIYVVGVKSATINGTTYLPPLAGSGFIPAGDAMSAYTGSIEIAGDTIVIGLDAGMRTPEPADPLPEVTPEPTDPSPEETPEPTENPERTVAASAGMYANRISGMLWLDTNGDGIRDADEQPLLAYLVSLYREDDLENAIRNTTTLWEGEYGFNNIEPGTYVVGVKSSTINGTEYLLPLVGIQNDNKFEISTADNSIAYSEPIEIAEDTVITGIDAAMRTPEVQPGFTITVTLKGYLQITDENGYPLPGLAWEVRSFSYLIDKENTTCTYSAPLASGITDSNGCFSVDETATGLYDTGEMFGLRALVKFPDETQDLHRIGSFTVEAFSETRKTSHNGGYSLDAFGKQNGGYSVAANSGRSGSSGTSIYTWGTEASPYRIKAIGTQVSPVVTTGEASNIAKYSATVSGTYDLKGYSLKSGRFYYGISPNSFAGYEIWSTSSTTTGEVSVDIKSGLGANTLYYYWIDATISTEGSASGEKKTFITPPDVRYVFTGATGPRSLRVSASFFFGLNNQYPTNVEIFYNTTNTIPETAQITVGSGAAYLDGFDWVPITGLTPDTLYYIWVRETSTGGMDTKIATESTPPEITSVTISSVSATSASVSAVFTEGLNLYPNGVKISYDTTDTKPKTPQVYVGAGPEYKPGFTNKIVTGLMPNTHYYVWVDQSSYGGKSVTSEPVTFTTLPCIDTVEATPTGSTTATILGAIAKGSETISDVIITYAEDESFTQNPVTIDVGSGVSFDDATHSYTASLTGLTAGQTYYVKVEAVGPGGTSEPVTTSFFAVGTTIDVTFPTSGMDFHVDQTTYPNVKAGTFGQNDVYYAFTNGSDYPIDVAFNTMQVVTGDGISFVPEFTGASDEIVLNLDIPSAAVTGGATNAFTTGVSNLDPASIYSTRLGVLAGQVISSGAATSGDTGYLTLGGEYDGPLSAAVKQPVLKFELTFSLITTPNGQEVNDT